MARLLSPPRGLPENFREPLSGPRAIGAVGTTSIGGFVQTVGQAFGLWRWRFGYAGNMRWQILRRFRGWIVGLHGGANASRRKMCDWDGLTLEQMGITSSRTVWQGGQYWSNGRGWSSGKWKSTPPLVPVASAQSTGDTSVTLNASFWGHDLGIGDYIGFMPFHFGMYMVTQVLGTGSYRIWPPLRGDLDQNSYATLRPTVVLRLESEDSASAARGPSFAENPSVVMVEVMDRDVRDYFAD